jgi:hypothetical protein
VTDVGRAKAVMEHNRLEAITRRLAARNGRTTHGGGISILSLAETDSHATLLENGRPIARWAIEDPNIVRHIEALLGE